MIRIIIALALMISQANAATRRSEPAAELKNGRSLGCLHAATTPASKGLGAANLLIVA